ncbi:ABC transporter substrate-binding protein [Beggiatoa leptomitoformis]|uniref:ABC transporter substrate-binding protein n=1 Tax=Beggiatoa leptomitoformis TaxID=288004 RepID=A0A2N9YEH8_9GAMM|nr:ABC transporter substrate-binding protein [Beggiatoa leptomitoformis]ALG68838.1 ABC transporter substrate-binding protein [Beggiatoa leptomitoformis]AUI68795.1 ABC transporter substrate-binding protein [Beggiatoa leptomitoformis]
MYRLILVFSLACLAMTLPAREVTDADGRKVTVPDTVKRVYGASPPVTYLLYAFDPAVVIGLNFPFNADEKSGLDPKFTALPVVGGWFGQGMTPNFEEVLRQRPDVMLVWRNHFLHPNEGKEFIEGLPIPYVAMNFDKLANEIDNIRVVGDVLNQPERAQALLAYARQTLETAEKFRMQQADKSAIRVYYAESPDGLQTECQQSFHAELIELAGAQNVHQCVQKNLYGREQVSMEQVLQYNPAVIIAFEPAFYKNIWQNPSWQLIDAVKQKKVYLIPRRPFNWFDRPPSFMRFMGLQWLMAKLHPEDYKIDLIKETRDFYKLFLRITLDEAQARDVLGEEK